MSGSKDESEAPACAAAKLEPCANFSDKSISAFKSHREELRDHFKFVWSEYMKWFSFFCTFNLTAIAVIHTVGAPPGFSPLVSAFLAISVIGSGSSLYMCAYSKRVCRTLSELDAEIRKNTLPVEAQEAVSQKIAPTLPNALTVWASLVNFLAIAIFISIWLFISIHGSFPTKKI